MPKFLKKGDRVLVWSLQSFFGGGFLKGEPAFLRQDQHGDSLILCVVRMKDTVQIDEAYEVYYQQVVPVKKHHWNASKDLKKLRKQFLKDGKTK